MPAKTGTKILQSRYTNLLIIATDNQLGYFDYGFIRRHHDLNKKGTPACADIPLL